MAQWMGDWDTTQCIDVCKVKIWSAQLESLPLVMNASCNM